MKKALSHHERAFFVLPNGLCRMTEEPFQHGRNILFITPYIIFYASATAVHLTESV